MQKYRILLLLLLFVTQAVINAQGTEPTAPWPPDPDTIFEEGVQWEAAPPQRLDTDAYYDYRRRVIHVFDTESESWLEFLYPAGWDDVNQVTKLPNGQVQVARNTYGGSYLLAENVYWLNIDTGRYTRPSTICNGLVIREDAENGEWVIIPEATETQVLCHTATDERLDILPEHPPYWSVRTSPDQSAIVLIGRDEAPTGDFQILGYNVADQELIEIGTRNRYSDDVLSYCGWVSSTQGLLCLSDYYRSWPGTAFYTFDTTQPDSLEYAFHTWGGNYLFLEDIKRYAAVHSDDYSAFNLGSRSQSHTDCYLAVLDSAGRRTVTLGYECLLLSPDSIIYQTFFTQDSVIYYLTKDSDDAAVSTLKHYNLERESGNFPWFSAEIETILGVSPDHRYIVLAMDDNQHLGTYSPEGFQIAIWDFSEQRIVYQSEPINLFYPSGIAWINDHTVVMGAYTVRMPTQPDDTHVEIPYLSPSSIRTIILNSDGSYQAMISTEYHIDYRNPFHVRQNSCYFMHENRAVVDLYTYEAHHVIQESAADDYTIRLFLVQDSANRLRIHITPKDDEYSITQSVSYETLLPDCTAPQP